MPRKAAKKDRKEKGIKGSRGKRRATRNAGSVIKESSNNPPRKARSAFDFFLKDKKPAAEALVPKDSTVIN